VKGGIKSFGRIEWLALVSVVMELWALKSVEFVTIAALFVTQLKAVTFVCFRMFLFEAQSEHLL
jgi:hypothetical protein